MSAGQQPRIEYVEARRVLLDALATPCSTGTRLAVHALSRALHATRVTTTVTEYTRQLLALTRPSGGLVDVLPHE